MTAERKRLEEAAEKVRHWRRWGPYLSERAWGTVREDYSRHGTAWDYFPHDHARSKAYRWGEDGIAGISDNHQRLCFALALWNGRDPILKERLFGLNGHEGNHGEDAKECYYYLDSTPTHSYMKCLYKYPQAEFPYARLVEGNRGRGREHPELELIDTGVFDENRYFDVEVEYAKADADDMLIRITAINRGPDPADLHVLPTAWLRNTWSWGRPGPRPWLGSFHSDRIEIRHASLGAFDLWLEDCPRLLFTENETNTERLYGVKSGSGHYKDAFHELLIRGRQEAVSPEARGTKACGWYQWRLNPGESKQLRLRLSREQSSNVDFDSTFAARLSEADDFYSFLPAYLSDDARRVQRQAFAGLLWSKQFFHYVVDQWLHGDPAGPPPDPARKQGRNAQWIHFYTDDILSMPDKWEYPWFAAWDTAFHMITFSVVDPEYAKRELGLFLREWYMHPNGQIPAYEWAFNDVNPPVHAWACWRVYKIDGKLQGRKDIAFLERVFHKLMLNFTWWVNRKDRSGDNIFEGGFLGLDNIGVFDRSAPLPTGGYIEQSDGTSWMAMYCLNMLRIALELALHNPVYEDVASKFFEHFLYIASAMNQLGGTGLWEEADGFFYDRLRLPDGRNLPMKLRSMVGLIPLFAVDTLEPEILERLPGFRTRMEWFIENRQDLCRDLASMTRRGIHERRLLAICQASRLRRGLSRMLDEKEFLSPYGIRSLSRFHKDHPYVLQVNGAEHRVDYQPAESTTGIFGGNSNWRGPIWFPVNYLLIESLQKFNHYYGDDFRVEFPTGGGKWLTLGEVAAELSRRLGRLFLRDESSRRPVFGHNDKLQQDPHFRDHVLFYEYFHGDHGAGLGASHQTGWTSLVAKLIQQSGV
ncbi:MAG: glucosidase [Acidimicrobiia bacterium]|nr:glucosidase [Acidimicrobiia bacterium]